MSDVPQYVTDLIDLHAKAQARMKRAEATFGAAKKDFDDLDVALSVLRKHGYLPADPHQPAPKSAGSGEEPLNDNYLLMLRHIPFRADWAVAPKYVTGEVHKKGREDLSADYIRTALWRMAKRGILESNDGRYWRPRKEEASDAETAEASKVRMGLADGSQGRGYPPSP